MEWHGKPCARCWDSNGIYMGDVDLDAGAERAAHAPLGAEVPGEFRCSKTLKDAISEAMRDWVTNVRTTYYLPAARWGASLSTMVADISSRHQHRDEGTDLAKEGRLPTAVIACVGVVDAIGAFL